MISDLVKTCGVLSSNIELSVCTKTRRVRIVKAASSSECPPVSVDYHRFCLAFFLISLNFFFYDTESWISKDKNNMMSKCVLESVYIMVLYMKLC